jgi:general secretion pathway protein A
MYHSFFGLLEPPFSITPDPRYLFLSARHAEALAHLVYGVSEAGGFIQLTGEVGTGKTTVVRSLLARDLPGVEIALILNPRLNVKEFLQTLCQELKIRLTPARRGSIKALMDIIGERLLSAHAEGRRVALLIDEAHLLDREVLEQVRLLTNIETPTRKLLQIILIGQPELRDLLARQDLRQVAQRITGRHHLQALSADETAAYVCHRLQVAGATTDIFTPRALAALHRASAGLPRLINVVADRALLGAYAREQRTVDAAMVRRAAAEVSGRESPYRANLWPWLAAFGVLLVLITSVLWITGKL